MTYFKPVYCFECGFGLQNSTVLQLIVSPWTTEASTRERWQFGTLK